MAFLTAAPGFDSNHRSSCRAASLHSTCTSPSTPARHRCNGFTKARVFHYSVPTNQQRSTRLPTVSSLSTAQQQLDLTTTLTSIVLSATFLLCPLLHVDSVDAVESPINEQQVLVFDHDQTLSDADFSNRTDLKGAIFSKANCKGANFQSADLTNAQLDDANMIGANLENVVAVNVTATKTKFQKANMKNADFTNANLVSAVFDVDSNIEGADFTDSLIDRTTNLKLCKIAKGVNAKSGVSTSESLMCPE